MVAGNTGASHLSRKSRPPKGALISQPMVEQDRQDDQRAGS